jgi:hypothetical protein
MAKLQHNYPGKLLGAGRSGQVFLVTTQEGLIAKKIFYTDKIAGIIHYFFFGSPNPYIWNEEAKGRKKKVAQFIVYDFFTRIGNKIPGWGGEDTQTEHFFNLFADKIAHRKTN